MKVYRTGRGFESYRNRYFDEFDAGLEDLALGMAGGLQQIAPYDTGNFRDSIRVERVGAFIVVIVSDVEYAVFLEFGTVFMDAQPTFRPGYEQQRQSSVAHLRARLARVA